MDDGPKVLIVDDDPDTLKLIRANLEVRGYSVKSATTGAKALAAFGQEPFDLVILDLVLPDTNGIDVCAQMRQKADTPVIVLSAYGDEEMKVHALDAGADDYVTKPFGADELLARMRAVTRRATGPGGVAGGKVITGELMIDLGARRVFCKGSDVRLTRTEFALLAELAQNIESVVTHDELLTRVWGPEYKGSSHYLHVYLGRIRDKIGPSSAVLDTIPGVGYILHSAPA